MEDVHDQDMQKQIRRAALNTLARRDHSQHELTQKLMQRGHALAAINIIINKLTADGWLNDQRFAENFIRARRNKGYGPQRIALELQARGIAAEIIEELLEIRDDGWLTAVRTTWHKRFKGTPAQDVKDRAKQIRFLQYRGFTQEQIKSVFTNN